MLYKLGDNTFDVDVAATMAYYAGAVSGARFCFCPACRNFCERLRRMSYTKQCFFKTLGVVPELAEKAWPCQPGDEDMTQHYMCLYPIKASVESYSDVPDFYETQFYAIEKDFRVGFYLKDGAPYLVVDWTLPWARP